MKVRDVLASKGSTVVTVKTSDTIAVLSQLLRANRIGAAVVSDDGLKIDGVISERDLAYGLGIHAEDLRTLPVSALMTKIVITCSPNDTIAQVASTMLSRNFRHLPVEENSRLVGMVSIRDILKDRVDELQQQTALLYGLVKKNDHSQQDRE